MGHLLRRWIAAAALAALPLAGAYGAQPSEPAVLGYIEVGEDEVVLRTSLEVEYNTLTLPAPPRLVLELQNTEFAAQAKSFPGKGKFLKAVRGGQFQSSPKMVARVVLELKEMKEFKVSKLKKGLKVQVGPPKEEPAPAAKPPVAQPATPVAAKGAVAAWIGTLEGRARLRTGSTGPWTDAKEGQAVSAGSQIQTLGPSTVILAFTNGTKVRIGPDSNFKVEEAGASKIELFIGVGKLEAWVKGLNGGLFVARSPVAVASVRGTVFSMTLPSPSQCVVDLFSGSIDITDNFGNTTPISPGQRIEAEATGGIVTMASLPPEATPPPEPPVDAPPPAGMAAPPPAEKTEEKAEEKPAEEKPAEETTTTTETAAPPPANPVQDTQTVSPSSP